MSGYQTSDVDALAKAARALRRRVQTGARYDFCGADMLHSRAAGSRSFVHFHGCPVLAVDHALERLAANRRQDG